MQVVWPGLPACLPSRQVVEDISLREKRSPERGGERGGGREGASREREREIERERLWEGRKERKMRREGGTKRSFLAAVAWP